jgi:hypothetical protein
MKQGTHRNRKARTRSVLTIKETLGEHINRDPELVALLRSVMADERCRRLVLDAARRSRL